MSRLRTHLVTLASSAGAAALLSVATGVLLARFLGPVDRGTYGEALFWAAMINGLTILSFPDAALVRIRSKEQSIETEIATLFNMSAIVTLVNLGILLILVLTPLHALLNVPRKFLIFYGAYAVITNLIYALSTIERARLSFATLAVERILTPASFGILLFVLIAPRPTVGTALFCLVAANVPVLAMRVARTWRQWAFGLHPNSLLQMMKVGLQFHAVALLAFAVTQADKALAISLFSTEHLGYYLVAFSLTGTASSVMVQALPTVMLPYLVGEQTAEKKEALQKLFRVLLVGAVAVAILLAAASPLLVYVLLGPAYKVAGEYAQILAFALMPLPLYALVETAALAKSRRAPSLMHATMLAVIAGSYASGVIHGVIQLGLVFFVGRVVAIAIGFHYLSRGVMGLSARECVLLRRADIADLHVMVREMAAIPVSAGAAIRARVRTVRDRRG